MNFKFTFKRMESSKNLMDLAIDKVGAKIEQFGGSCIHPHFTFSCDRNLQKVHFSMLTSDGFPIEVSHAGKNIYGELDEVAERIAMQLRRHKERRSERRRGGVSLRGLSRRLGLETLGNRSDLGDEAADEQVNYTVSAEDVIKYEAARRAAPWNEMRSELRSLA